MYDAESAGLIPYCARSAADGTMPVGGMRVEQRRRLLISEREAARRLDVTDTALRKRRKKGQFQLGREYILVEGRPRYIWPVLYDLRRPT
jgi:hypothetical protein